MFSLRICRKSRFIKILSILQYEYVRKKQTFHKLVRRSQDIFSCGNIDSNNLWDSVVLFQPLRQLSDLSALKVGPDSAFFLMYTITCSVSLGTILASKRCEPWLGKISMSKLRKLTGHLYSKGLIWGKRFVINAR